MGRSTFPDGTAYNGSGWIYRGARNAIYLRDFLRCLHRAEAVEHARAMGRGVAVLRERWG